MNFTNRPFLQALFCGIIGMLLYSKTIHHEYVLDDYDAIVENAYVTQGLDGLSAIWTTEYRAGFSTEKGSLYRPLASSLFATEWQFWPNDPNMAHGLNIILYGLACGLLFYWLWLLFGISHRWLPLMTTVIFATHPIHTEVVANIKSADELLALIFGLLTLIASLLALRGKLLIWTAVAVLAFFLAMVSKEGAITLLPVVALSVWLFDQSNFKTSLKLSGLLLLPLLFYFFLRHQALGGFAGSEVIPAIDNILADASGLTYFTSAIAICGIYLWKLFLPTSLSHDYSLNEIQLVGFSDIGFWFSLLVGISLLLIVFRFWKREPIVAFAVLFFLLTFSLYSNLVLTIGTHFGERLLFLPSMGYAVAIAWLIWKWGSRKSGQFQWGKSILPTVVFGLLCFAFAGKTIARADEWKDELTLYKADVEHAPKSCRTHYRYARALNKLGLAASNDASKQKYFSEAAKELNLSIQIYDQFADAYGELGLAQQNLGRYEEAIFANKKALELNPNHATTINNMGTVLFLQNKQEEAIPYFKRAFELKPNFRDAAGNLGSCYGTLQRYEEAITWFVKATEIDPSYAPNFYFVALSYKNMGDEMAYEKWLAKAKKIDPRIGE
jgi:protein O-mannosyl-transferase